MPSGANNSLPRKAQHIGGAAAGRVADQVREDEIVAVVVIPGAAGRRLELGMLSAKAAMSGSMNFIRLTGSSARASEACSELPSARPAVWRSRWSTVMAWRGSSAVLPRGDRRGLVEGELALANEDADQRGGDRLGRGKAEQRRIDADSRRHSARQRCGHPSRTTTAWCGGTAALGLGEGAVERGARCGVAAGPRRDRRSRAAAPLRLARRPAARRRRPASPWSR